MKTNKERSKIILQRYKNLSIAPYKEETIKKSKTNIFTKKFWIYSSCAAVVMLSAILGLVFGLKGNGNNNNPFNLDNMYIANFSNYKAFGAATETSEQVNTVRLAGKGQGKKYMVGITEDGEVEKVKVSETEDGEGQEIKWDLVCMQSYKNFTIATYTTWATTGTVFEIGKGLRTVIIDNRTGKIFSLDELHDFSTNSYTSINIYSDVRYKNYTSPFPYYAEGFESNDSIYFYTIKNGYPKSFYKATIENGDLKIKEIFDLSAGSNMVDINIENTFVDKYNNIYLRSGYRSGIYQYMITSQGMLKSLEKEIVLSANGIVYTTDGAYCINETGQLVASTFANYNLFVRRDNLIKKVGNTEYYYDGGEKITKIVWSSDSEYTYEKITVENLNISKSFKYAVTADKIFIMQDQELFCVGITDGKKISSITDYFFTSIGTDYLGNVTFVALDSYMNDVNGIIKNDNSIDINIEKRKFEVYYIKALNV